MSKRIDGSDIIGKEYGRLSVIRYAYYVKGEHWYWCKCNCGKQEHLVRRNSLVCGRQASCGCLRDEVASETHKGEKNFRYKHGDCLQSRQKRLHRILEKMHERCNNPNHKSYKYYGGRGIKVCEEWNDYTNFKDWALSNGYQDNLTIDRIDNEGNYDPNNCQWITRSENTIKSNKERSKRKKDKNADLSVYMQQM